MSILSPFLSPPLFQVVEVNRSLTESVERLSDESSDALGHLQLILEWWSEFTSNHGDMTSWLEGMEERVTALEDQLTSTVSPRPCPLTLQQTGKVHNKLCPAKVSFCETLSCVEDHFVGRCPAYIEYHLWDGVLHKVSFCGTVSCKSIILWDIVLRRVSFCWMVSNIE